MHYSKFFVEAPSSRDRVCFDDGNQVGKEGINEGKPWYWRGGNVEDVIYEDICQCLYLVSAQQ